MKRIQLHAQKLTTERVCLQTLLYLQTQKHKNKIYPSQKTKQTKRRPVDVVGYMCDTSRRPSVRHTSQCMITFIAEIDMSMPGFAPALTVGSSARVSRHGGFPVPCCCCTGVPNGEAPAPNPPNPAAGAAPNNPPAGAAAGARNAPVAARVGVEPNSPVVVVAVVKPPKPPVAGAGAGAPNTPPTAGAGAGAPKRLEAGLPKGLDAVVDPKAPPKPVAGAGAPNGLAGGAVAPKALVVKPNAPPAAGAGVVPKGEVEVVRPNADVPAAGAPKVVAGAGAGAPNTLGLAPKAVGVVPKPPVLVLPNACGSNEH